MKFNPEAFADYLECLRTGAVEVGYFGLLELGPDALPLLIAEARKPESRAYKITLVEVIWQHRHPVAIPFLGETLSDSDPEVWKSALDGLVTIGGPDAIQWMTEALEGVETGRIHNGLSKEWLEEALQQAQGRW
jgi:hypothetical protein